MFTARVSLKKKAHVVANVVQITMERFRSYLGVSPETFIAYLVRQESELGEGGI